MKNNQNKQDQLYFLPLGGCGIFGANATLYGYNGKWILVDCGMGFPDETLPSIDILLPDLEFLYAEKDNLLACIVTHAHEDHIGALEYLWPSLKCPIYATQFAAGMLRSKFSAYDWGNKVPLHVVPVGGEITDLDPFHIKMICMAHSIPEAQSLAITAGELPPVLHTGDWKLDANPCISHVTDEAELRALGDNGGALAVIGDSTNAMIAGHSGSELTVRNNLTKLFSEYPDSRIFVAAFASNTARVDSIARAAIDNGREIALSGRSLWRGSGVARSCGYLSDLDDFLDEGEAMKLPRGKSVIVCTGSQGESRAALARIARGEHRTIKPQKGDLLVFSALRIPGNEVSIDRMLGYFWEMGVEVITNKTRKDFLVHVSGHPCQDEIKSLYDWTKPKIAIPVHGEAMQMDHNAQIAKDCGVEHIITGRVGSVYHLCPEVGVSIIDEVPHGLLAMESGLIRPIHDEALNVRRRIAFNGAVVVSLVLDSSGNLQAEPMITALGLVDEKSREGAIVLEQVSKAVTQAIESLPKSSNEDQIIEKARIVARKFFYNYCGKKPQARVHLFSI